VILLRHLRRNTETPNKALMISYTRSRIMLYEDTFLQVILPQFKHSIVMSHKKINTNKKI